jgi:hypothetical protein
MRSLLIGSSADSDRMFAFRTTSLLSAVVLTVLQPALALCECAGCHKGCAAHGVDASTSDAASTRSCCSHAESGNKSCCGARADACPCGSCRDSDALGSQNAVGGKSCSCSAPSHATAVESRALQVDNALSVHHWLAADAIRSSHNPASAIETACSAERGPPPRFGNLRVHAYLGVWIV